jgi:hypothetical protein
VYRYDAYGLSIHAEMPLPELLSGGARPADVTIRFGNVGRPGTSPDPQTSAYRVTPDEVCFFWEQVGAFRVRGGREIVVEPVPSVEEDLLRLPLLGSVFGVLLHQRGLAVLHASAVNIRGQAAIFLGAKGQGKSTTAATLVGRGHQLIADDIVALDPAGEPAGGGGDPLQPRVRPGFPQLKLFDDAAASALGDDPAQLPYLASIVPKRARRTPGRFSDGELPAGAIFVLADGPDLTVTRITGSEAICEVVGSSIPARFGRALLDGDAARAHFDRCVTLVKRLSIYRLERPRDLTGLVGLGLAVEQVLDRRQPAFTASQSNAQPLAEHAAR